MKPFTLKTESVLDGKKSYNLTRNRLFVSKINIGLNIGGFFHAI